MFNFNFYKAIISLLPFSLRQPKTIAWLKVFVALIKKMKDDLLTYRNESLFFLAHNSQVIYLEHILNAKFNPDGNLNDGNYVGNGIYISDPEVPEAVVIYNKSEVQAAPVIYNKSEGQTAPILYNKSESGSLAGFIVNVPISFNADLNKLRALVNSLKLAGKPVKINTY